ncbi:AarF/UbiB family protein [Luedemannella flava]
MTRLRGQVWYGLVRCCVVVPLWLLLVPAVMGGRRLLVRRHRDVPAWAAALAVLAVWLGPAYVKAAQLASTRADVVPAAWCRALGRLREDGRPIRAGYVRRQLAAHGFGLDPLRLLGAGSVACVYLVADPGGTGPVAVKLLRPGVRTAIARDLAVFRFGARVTARLPRARHLPILDMIGHIADAIAGQVDLVRERRTCASCGSGSTRPGSPCSRRDPAGRWTYSSWTISRSSAIRSARRRRSISASRRSP